MNPIMHHDARHDMNQDASPDMKLEVLEPGQSGYVTTRTAARMLGLSTSMVQLMLDRQEIEGWKTPGGHRRISTRSLQAFQQRKHIPVPPKTRPPRKSLIMVVSENTCMREQLQRAAAGWRLPFEYSWPVSLEAALCELLRTRPFQLVVELGRPAEAVSDILESLRALQALQTLELQTVITLVVSQDSQSLPSDGGVEHLPGPLSPDWLRAFLAGVEACQQHQRKKAGVAGMLVPATA